MPFERGFCEDYRKSGRIGLNMCMLGCMLGYIFFDILRKGTLFSSILPIFVIFSLPLCHVAESKNDSWYKNDCIVCFYLKYEISVWRKNICALLLHIRDMHIQQFYGETRRVAALVKSEWDCFQVKRVKCFDKIDVFYDFQFVYDFFWCFLASFL